MFTFREFMQDDFIVYDNLKSEKPLISNEDLIVGFGDQACYGAIIIDSKTVIANFNSNDSTPDMKMIKAFESETMAKNFAKSIPNNTTFVELLDLGFLKFNGFPKKKRRV